MPFTVSLILYFLRRSSVRPESSSPSVFLTTGAGPGVDGLVFEYHGHRATFLPQVWENIPEPLDFLCELRRKAGLPARFWHADVKLSRYGVEKHR